MRELTNNEIQSISGGVDIFVDAGHAIGTGLAKLVKFVGNNLPAPPQNKPYTPF